ncbi:hypothetical protein [Acanthopleuribacter pedis]|uniref:Uncharacterized protein n=1 Tax=Acanthopleuribacter pedis TaxID=442870 RepID=A0A8J7U7R5_9BACT|nr:hypothetical protein [Acanthopleuribacter pedis]MBO1322813.1 hypothetical protein [Acanthopleuribacter pedis]
MESLLSGAFEIKVVAPDPPPPSPGLDPFAEQSEISPRDLYFNLLNQTLDAITDAIECDLLAPGEMVRCPEPPPPVTRVDRTTLVRRFHADHLPPGCFRMVEGMLTGFGYLFVPLFDYEIKGSGITEATFRAPYPPLLGPLPFPVTRKPSRTTMPYIDDLYIIVDFETAVAAQERAAFIAGFKTWEQLLVGGFRMTGDPQSWSNIAASEVAFVSPDRLQWNTETLLAHPACFHLLLNMLSRRHQSHPIREVSIG